MHILILTILGTLVSSTIFIQVNAKENMLSPKSENTLVIDGKWTTADEWSDALEGKLKFTEGSGEAYIRLKHDAESLYVLIDYVSLKEPKEEDTAIIMIDTTSDGGDILQKDDLILMSPLGPVGLGYGHGPYITTENAWMAIAWGTGFKTLDDFTYEDWEEEPEGFSAASATDAENNPYSTEDHVIWEFGIPKSEFKSEIDTIGFAAVIVSEKKQNIASYPFADVNKPRLWAFMEFSSYTLAELASDKTPTLTTTLTTTLASTPTPTSKQTYRDSLTIGVLAVTAIVLTATLILRRKK